MVLIARENRSVAGLTQEGIAVQALFHHGLKRCLSLEPFLLGVFDELVALLVQQLDTLIGLRPALFEVLLRHAASPLASRPSIRDWAWLRYVLETNS
ncbi:hypothetical protein D3C80_1642620 [compost metagenome]